MIETAICNHYDDHERYLDLFTGKDQNFWGHRHDSLIAKSLNNYHRKRGRFISLIELEERNDKDSIEEEI